MAVTDVNVIDGIAFDDDNKTLIMEIYDHLHFEGKFEFDHIVILQDKLNTYSVSYTHLTLPTTPYV